MPDVPSPVLTGEELAARRALTRDAVASARIEGATVTADTRRILEEYDQGRISEDEAIERIRQQRAARSQ